MKFKSRKDIPEEYKWNLSLFYATDEDWEKDYNKIEELGKELSSYKGKLGNPQQLLDYYKKEDDAGEIITRLYIFAQMKSHEDLREGKYRENFGRLMNKYVAFSSVLSFEEPEINASYTVEELTSLSKEPQFADYSYRLSELARKKQRILSEKEELILSKSATAMQMSKNAFELFDNADVKLKPAKDSEGKKHEMTAGTYGVYIYNSDRKLRKNAHDNMMKGYGDYINTLSALYAGLVDKDIFYSSVRGYKSCLEMAMDTENVPEKVYNNLIEAVHGGIRALKDYRAYRGEVLGIKEAKAYDMYVDIEQKAETKTYTFEEAFEIVKSALGVLGEDYVKLLDKAKAERWMDVYETPGKRGGAYSWGCHTTLPYVLLNFMGMRNDVFTMAHELGHSMHSYYSRTTQPLSKSDYEIFVAEIASTVNETLLLKHLLKNATKEEKKALLAYRLDMFKGTVFRQTLFAEFEKNAHELVENGGALSADNLCDIYQKLNEQYYGKGYCTPNIKYEWARIPHFYNSFYVYKYATGLLSATVIAEDIFNGKKGAVENYKKFLSAGGSMPPHDILKLTGVDLTTKAPFEQAMKVFADTLAELKALN